MNRRGFLKALGCLAAVPVVAKLVPEVLVAPEPAGYTTYLVGADAIVNTSIGQYADYISFSDIAFGCGFSPEVKSLAEEMSYRIALTVSGLCPDRIIMSPLLS